MLMYPGSLTGHFHVSPLASKLRQFTFISETSLKDTAILSVVEGLPETRRRAHSGKFGRLVALVALLRNLGHSPQV